MMPSTTQEAASIPEAPPVVEGVPDPVPPPPADGLHRFIIRPAVPVVPSSEEETPSWMVDDEDTTDPSMEPEESLADAEGSVSGAEAREEDTAPMVAPPRDPAWTLDQTLAARIDEDTTVVFVDGIPGFYDGDEFVPLIGNSTASSGAPVAPLAPVDDDPMTEDDLIEELLDIEGVVSAVAVGDGTFAVVTEEEDVLDGRGLAPVIDTPFALAADPYEPYQWTLDNTGDNLNSLSNPPNQTVDADIDGLEAKAGARGEGVIVAVIDTGVDFSHPDLAGQSWVNEDEICNNLSDDDGNGFVDDCNGWDFGNEDNQPYGPGQQEHGTHVAGTIAAIADNGVGVVGMAPEVMIMDLNVEGPGGMTMSGISRAVRYAADNGAHIINMSLGTQPGTPAGAVTGLIDAVRYAEAKGSLVVVAAGNSSVNLDSSPVYPANIEGSNMITVGASAPDETKASFSNYGSPVDLFAPGVLIVSTVPGGGYKFMNGTSMASPTVAGAAAAVLSAFPDLDPLGVREQLVGTGDEAPSYGGLAANPVRINQAWAIGLDGDPEVAQVAVTGLVDVTTEAVVADISMTDPGGDYTEPYRWEASLVAIADGQAYGLVDHPLAVDWQDDATDDQGAFDLAAGGDGAARLTTQLPPGTYGLVVEAVPEADSTMRLGDAFVTTFVVPAEPEPEPEPDPGDGGPTTTTPGGVTTTEPSSGPSTTTEGPTTTQWSNTTLAWPPTVPSTTTSGPTTTAAWGTQPPSTTSPPVTGSPTTSPPASAIPTTSSPSPTTAAPTTSPPVTGSPTTSPPATSPPTTGVITTSPPATGSPTTSPATTVPGTTAPPTTAPQTTVPPTSPPTTTAEGGFVLTRISPTAGYINQQTMVSLDGTFPSMVNVWMGDQPGQLVHHSSTWIIVVAPARSVAGDVDVSLRSSSAGTVLLARDAFTYLDPNEGQQTTPPTTTPAGEPTTSTTSSSGGGGGGGGTAPSTTTSPGGGNPTTTTPPPDGGAQQPTTSTTTPSGDGGDGGGGVTTSTPGATTAPAAPSSSTTVGDGEQVSTTAVDEPTTTTEPPGVPRRVRATASGEPVDLGGGLQGVPLQGLGGLGDVPVCMSEPCRSRRV